MPKSGFLTTRLKYSHYPKYSHRFLWAKNADPDQTEVQSVKGLHIMKSHFSVTKLSTNVVCRWNWDRIVVISVISAVSRQNMSEISNQVRHKPGCTATEYG